MNIVVDTNIFISALIRDGICREILTNFNLNFIFPETCLEDIYFYKQEIMEKAKINAKEFDILLLRLLKYLKLIPLDMVISFKENAYIIMKNIDEDDSIFIATALAFNCPIWSEDKHFKKQNKIKILTTKEILALISS